MEVLVRRMRHGLSYIYEYCPAEARFEEIVEIVSQGGISLERPGNGEIARFSGQGDRIRSSKQDILRELRESKIVRTQLWLDAITDVFCSIEELGSDVVRESYSLDGKTEQESLYVISSLIKLFAYRAQHGTAFAMVVDRFADLRQDFHWDDFILGTTKPPELPMFLGLSKDFARIKDPLPLPALTDEGTYLALRTEPFDSAGSIDR